MTVQVIGPVLVGVVPRRPAAPTPVVEEGPERIEPVAKPVSVTVEQVGEPTDEDGRPTSEWVQRLTEARRQEELAKAEEDSPRSGDA